MKKKTQSLTLSIPLLIFTPLVFDYEILGWDPQDRLRGTNLYVFLFHAVSKKEENYFSKSRLQVADEMNQKDPEIGYRCTFSFQ